MTEGRQSLMCGVFFVVGTLVGGGLQALRTIDQPDCVVLGEVVSREIVETQVGYLQREWHRPHCFDRPAAMTGGAHE